MPGVLVAKISYVSVRREDQDYGVYAVNIPLLCRQVETINSLQTFDIYAMKNKTVFDSFTFHGFQ